MDHLMCDPHTTHQQDLMGLDYHLKIQGIMMADLNEGVPLQKAAQVKFDNLVQVKSHSNFANHSGRLDHLRNRPEIQTLLGMLAEIERPLVEKSMSMEKVLLQPILAEVIKMLKANDMDTGSFQKKHVRAILLIIFECSPKKSAGKKDLMDEVRKQTEKHPNKIDEAF